ncbi:hypothetical protein RIR_jg11543.t1 [Rhizophagus irregularis DAOM 181602=DAOM 197198]|nr:hypothetical protein RIR_jg11543.t1 [Rhizophagus irregularis DAOM 181602=DAOM 197198]
MERNPWKYLIYRKRKFRDLNHLIVAYLSVFQVPVTFSSVPTFSFESGTTRRNSNGRKASSNAPAHGAAVGGVQLD